MKKPRSLFSAAMVLATSIIGPAMAQESQQGMDKMWGDTKNASSSTDLTRGAKFRHGHYGMFIHWGLFSSLGGVWKGKTYYGIGEWIMNPAMAGIPAEDYREIAKTFNPEKFDAKALVQMAKDAGMSYLVITSKHHEGFAMFKSQHPFNIVDASPFHRDPMKELSDACREAGLGFGFYYSHFQDWTTPGASGGPKKNADGSAASFAKYFEEKCFPQVKEICTHYGPLEAVWFDTPGSMPKEHIKALHDLVRSTQPGALLNSRIGGGMGDYESQGDMDVPPEKISGLWETPDTTNDSWAYAWYDTNWKEPKEILRRVVSAVARGGNYLLNVGPDAQGVVPPICQKFLTQAGSWIKRHPEVVYGAGPSPWNYAMPWGDVTTQGEQILNLTVFQVPHNGWIYLPGLTTPVKSVSMMQNGVEVPVTSELVGQTLRLKLPLGTLELPACVIRLELAGKPQVDLAAAIHPNMDNLLLTSFAQVDGAEKKRVGWMEKFGEWKHVTQISKWTPAGQGLWKLQILEPGVYRVALKYRGKATDKSRVVWNIATDEGSVIQNQQGVTAKYQSYPMGVLEFKTPGSHSLTVKLIDGDPAESSLESLTITPVE